jgi:hypothetical protein
VVEAAHHDIGKNVNPPDEIELLENHRAFHSPIKERRAAKLHHIHAVEDDAAFARWDQAIDHSQ